MVTLLLGLGFLIVRSSARRRSPFISETPRRKSPPEQEIHFAISAGPCKNRPSCCGVEPLLLSLQPTYTVCSPASNPSASGGLLF
ncbi:hypothetical protein BDV09DRAFT_169984 [Aspergillus tetrazonus]